MKKIIFSVLTLVTAVSLAACSLPTPEEVKHSVDTQELGKISLTQEEMDEFVEPYIEILEKIKGIEKGDAEVSEEDKETLYEYVKNLSKEEFEKIVKKVTETSEETINDLFGNDDSGIDAFVDEAKKEAGH